jgi:hypothetical protein
VNIKERKIVMNYLRHIHYDNGLFVVVSKIRAKYKARKAYENMSAIDKKLILKKIIVDYLVAHLSGSMVLYYVNGTPNKRLYRMRELMYNKYENMNDEARDIIYNKILDN